jgi:hypothetical protein
MKTKRQRRREGDVVKISLGEGLHSYARVLPHAVLAFYDCFTHEELPLDRILSCPVLFKVPVMDSAVKSGRWPVVGSAPLEPELLKPPAYFMQDALHPDRFSISVDGVERPATREEAHGLERLAGWSAEHIEDRLRDAHAGRPNKWVESLRLR